MELSKISASLTPVSTRKWSFHSEKTLPGKLKELTYSLWSDEFLYHEGWRKCPTEVDVCVEWHSSTGFAFVLAKHRAVSCGHCSLTPEENLQKALCLVNCCVSLSYMLHSETRGKCAGVEEWAEMKPFLFADGIPSTPPATIHHGSGIVTLLLMG